MSETLFELTGQYKELYGMLTDSEGVDTEVIEDSIESVLGAIEKKGEGYIGLMNQLEMEVGACKKQAEVWANRAKTRENAIKNLKTRLAQAMDSMGLTEIKAGDTVIKLRNNGGQLPIIINGDVPTEYMRTKIIEEKDTDKIRKALNEGKKLDFAEFGERGKSVRW